MIQRLKWGGFSCHQSSGEGIEIPLFFRVNCSKSIVGCGAGAEVVCVPAVAG